MSDKYDATVELLREAIDEVLEEKLSELKDEITCEVSAELQDVVAQAVNETLSEMEFRLPDGAVIIPAPRLKLLTADRKKMLCCYGGLRVDKCNYQGGPEGYALWVQTRACSWDIGAFYEKKEDAMAALLAVKAAMEKKLEFIEL